MKKGLFGQAMLKFSCGLLLVGALLFLPAGTFDYWQAWLLLGVLFVPMFGAGLVMLFKAPELLRKRLNAKEEQGEQKTVVALSGLMFLAAFVAAGLCRRFSLLLPGAETNLYVYVNDLKVIVRMPSSVENPTEEFIKVPVDMAKAHFFDKESEQAICH